MNQQNILERAYQQQDRTRRFDFIRCICDRCGWSEQVFYDRRKGRSEISPLELKEIQKVIKQFGS